MVTASPRRTPSVAVMAPLASSVRWLLALPVESQQVARRNAMLACTSLTQRRTERQDVADFLVSFYGPSYGSFQVAEEA